MTIHLKYITIFKTLVYVIKTGIIEKLGAHGDWFACICRVFKERNSFVENRHLALSKVWHFRLWITSFVSYRFTVALIFVTVFLLTVAHVLRRITKQLSLSLVLIWSYYYVYIWIIEGTSFKSVTWSKKQKESV